MRKLNTLQILHVLMIAVDNLREFTTVNFFFVNPHFHTLLELSTTLTIAGDDLGDGTSQQVSGVEMTKWLYHGWENFPKIAVEGHPQFPEPRMATWQPVLGTELWQHGTDVSGKFWYVMNKEVCEYEWIKFHWCNMM